ncbi:cache domain-containing protein [Pseudaminobacter sp. 19-2017]|uniref:Cache domain-containing protein n=1 Tax=Pseudaminobacter soli (ex Zhang et al. 2022) TaxID=2831468 RepID=A0A942DVF0_9HYPH|nr:cache domain-containing protein [Pseudaminobacter soli]MBS3648039.1 cache domain-containing protein [Pseudaminobacter soli]
MKANASNYGRGLPTLSKSIAGFVLLGAVLIAFALWTFLTEGATIFREGALAEAVQVRSKGVELDFARALHQEWVSARTIAEDIAKRDPASIRSSLDLIAGNSRVSWAGIAGLDGLVRVASGGLLEGQDVSSRPWFQRGLEGPFAGDVHEAVLLAKLLPSEGGEPRRFLDLAMPIKDSSGNIDGVLGLHLDSAWAEQHLKESAEALGIEVFLVDRGGAVVLASAELDGDASQVPSMRIAETGSAAASLERWPDGQGYFTTVQPEVAYKDLPSFGWSLLARINDTAFLQGESSFSRSVVVFLGLIGLMLILLTILYIRMFASPIRRLAESASLILRGEPVYPYESRTTAEAATLSAVLARLQMRETNE